MSYGNEHPDYGRGEHYIDAKVEQGAADEALSRHLDALFASPDYRPPRLPNVAMQIMELSRRTEVTVAEIVTLLESDPMVAGRALRIVQSPIYAGRSSIRSLRQAVIRLGLNTMRDIVLEDAMNMRVFRSDSHRDWMEQVRKHSVLTGHCARLVAKTAQTCGEYAFMCGLLHDIGIAAILVAASEQKTSVDDDALLRAIQHRHEQASGHIASLWSMPKEIATVVGTHHTPRRDGKDSLLELASVVCLAEELATRVGVPALPASAAAADQSGDFALDLARKRLGIDAPTWDRLLEEAVSVMEQAGLAQAQAA